MLATLILQAVPVPQVTVVPAAPPAPPSQPSVPPSPPYSFDSRVAAIVFDVDVVVRAASGLLWQGTLRVADRGGDSSWSQSRTEPPRGQCPARPTYWSGERDMLNVSVGSNGRDPSSGVNVTVRWTRRGDSECDGIRTVELRQTVPLAAHGTAVVTGDGGLRVELRRR